MNNAAKKDAPKKTVKAPVDYQSLNKFLLGTLAEVKRDEIQLDKATTIAQLSTVVIKNNLSAILYDEKHGINRKNNFFEGDDQKQIS